MPGAQDKGTEGWRGATGKEARKSKRGGWCKKNEKCLSAKDAGTATLPGALLCSQGFAAPVPLHN